MNITNDSNTLIIIFINILFTINHTPTITIITCGLTDISVCKTVRLIIIIFTLYIILQVGSEIRLDYKRIKVLF